MQTILPVVVVVVVTSTGGSFQKRISGFFSFLSIENGHLPVSLGRIMESGVATDTAIATITTPAIRN